MNRTPVTIDQETPPPPKKKVVRKKTAKKAVATKAPEKPLAVVQAPDMSPLVNAMLDNKFSAKELKEMFKVQRSWEKNEAEKAFHQALANFKSHDIVLKKDKLVSFDMKTGGKKEYRHTTLGYALTIINPLLSKYGLSLTWRQSQDMEHGGIITVTCKLSHAMGYSQETALTASPDASGNKNSIQAIGSTIQYLERYTAFSLVGVSSMDDDDDGETAEIEALYISPEEVGNIYNLLAQHKIGKLKFLDWLSGPPVKAKAVETIQPGAYKEVLKRIKSHVEAQAKKAKEDAAKESAKEETKDTAE